MRLLSSVLIGAVLVLVVFGESPGQTATYVGSQRCSICHSGAVGNQFNEWKETLHSKIHEIPSAATVTGDFITSTSISMGSSYGNAVVMVRTDGSKYYATVGGAEYEIAFTYGGGWKQRYLTKIDSSYYILPIQWNSNAYKDNSSGSWASYTPGTWFNADGTGKSTTSNSFRTKSWDKNCMGCHVTGYRINSVAAAADTFWVGQWANKYSTAESDIVVGCESCHGPGSLHATTGDKTKILNPDKDLTDNNRKLEVCGQCHNRASSWKGSSIVGSHEYGKNELIDTYFVPGDTLSKYMRFDGTPNQSGGPGMWPDLETPRQHHQQYQDWLISTHYSQPFEEINCFTCHDPHKDTGDHQVRTQMTVGGLTFTTQNDDNTICLSCHATFPPFAGITKDMVQNEPANRAAIGAVVSEHTKHSAYDPLNESNTGGIGRCSKCHMTKTATTAKAYDIHAHNFFVVPARKTLEFSSTTTPTKGHINTCAASCHRNGTGNVPNFGITDADLSAWNEQTDLDLATELKFWDENMFFKERGGLGVALDALPAVTPPVTDADTSDWSDVSWVDISLANGKSASVKGKVSGSNLYLLFRWADPTMSMVRSGSWTWNGTTWLNNPGQSEDRISVMWNIDIPQDQWEKNGCMSKCHFDVNNPVAPDGDPEDDSYLPAGQHGDLWHMKPARALAAVSAQQSGTVVIDPTTHQATAGTFRLVGYLDDQNMKEYVGKPDGGRVGDAGTSADSRNRNSAQTAPKYIEKNPIDYIDAMVLTQAEIDAGETAMVDSITTADINTYWAKYATLNAVVPERYQKPPTGSRADVYAAGLWNNGAWYVEVQRALNTTNPDDATLTLNTVSTFGIAVMDNAGGEEHWTQGSVLNQLGVGIPVGVEIARGELPSDYMLFQNYPNPFNPSTEVLFSVPSTGNAKLEVFDILGRLVTTLVDQGLSPGTYRVSWDGRSSSGKVVASGMYLYRLSATAVSGSGEAIVLTRKMILIR